MAQRLFPERYTMEHKPSWADTQRPDGRYPAPQHRSDASWFMHTGFSWASNGRWYITMYMHEYPLGESLAEPYQIATPEQRIAA